MLRFSNPSLASACSRRRLSNRAFERTGRRLANHGRGLRSSRPSTPGRSVGHLLSRNKYRVRMEAEWEM